MLSQEVRQLLAKYNLPSHLAVACGVGLLLGVACLWFSPLWVLGGVLGTLSLVGIASRPELGLLAIVLITSGVIDFERLPLLKMGPIGSFHITDVILLYLLAMVLTKASVVPGFKVVRTPLDVPLIWFTLAILLSAARAIVQFSLDTHFVRWLLRPLTYYLGFFAVTNLIRHRRQLSVLTNGLFVIAVLASLAILVQVLDPSIQLVKSRSIELVTAGQEYEGILRTYMGADRLIYPMLLVSVCSLTLGSRWLPPRLEFARAGILSTGLLLTFLRSNWASMISMLALLGLLVTWRERARVLRWAVVGMIAVVLLVSLPGVLPEQYMAAAWERLVWGMRPETLAQDSATQMRAMETRHAIESIAQHPLLGIGLRNLYRPAIEQDAYWSPDNPHIGLRWYIHNAYLWVWIDMGLMGFIPFIWLYSSFLVRGFTRWRKIGDPKLRAMVLGFTLAILGQAISNVVAPNFIQSWVLIVFAIMMGINEVIFNWEVSEPPPVRRCFGTESWRVMPKEQDHG